MIVGDGAHQGWLWLSLFRQAINQSTLQHIARAQWPLPSHQSCGRSQCLAPNLRQLSARPPPSTNDCVQPPTFQWPSSCATARFVSGEATSNCRLSTTCLCPSKTGGGPTTCCDAMPAPRLFSTTRLPNASLMHTDLHIMFNLDAALGRVRTSLPRLQVPSHSSVAFKDNGKKKRSTIESGPLSKSDPASLRTEHHCATER
jgi:hypothetical protein